MKTTPLGNCLLSSSILKDIILTEDGQIKTSDIEVTQQISSLEYLRFDESDNTNNIVSTVNHIIAAFKGEQPPEPPTPKMFRLMLNSVGNDTSSIVDNVCTFSPESGTEILENTTVQLSVIPSTIYSDLKYTFLHWSDDTTLTSPVREVQMSSDITLRAVFDVNPVEPYLQGEDNSLLDQIYRKVNLSGEDTTGIVHVQNEDIDLTDPARGTSFWSGIGTKTNPFKGVYVGNGHTITVKYSALSGITPGDTMGDARCGIFSYLSGATIKDLSVLVKDNDNTISAFKYIAGIAGYSAGQTNFVNLSVGGTIGTREFPAKYPSGICGRVNDELSNTTNFVNCVNNAELHTNTANSKVGGILGYVYSNKAEYGAMLDRCVNNGTIELHNTLSCYQTGTNPTTGIGGLIGYWGQELWDPYSSDGAGALLNSCSSYGDIIYTQNEDDHTQLSNCTIHTIGGFARRIELSGNMHVRDDFQACNNPAGIGGNKPLWKQIDGRSEVELVPFPSTGGFDTVYKWMIPGRTIYLPSNTTTILMDTAVTEGKVVLDGSPTTIAVGTPIHEGSTIKRYEFQ